MAGPIRSEPRSETRAAIAQMSTAVPVTAPRPPNAWILYRSDKLKQLPEPAKGEPKRAQADVSRLISTMWRNESDATRAYYEQLADLRKAEHSLMYPGYRYVPMKKEERAALREQRKLEKEQGKKNRQNQRPHRGTSSQPQPSSSTAPTPVPSSALQIFPPIKAGTVYYPMELFGVAGPSPPVSAASSPEPTSSPEYTTSEEELNDTNPPTTKTSPQPSSSANPYLVYFNPGGKHQSQPTFPTTFTFVPQPSTSASATPLLQSPLVQQPQLEPSQANDHLQLPSSTSHVDYSSIMDNANQFQNIEQHHQGFQLPPLLDNLTFDVDQDFFASANALLDPNSSMGNSLDALFVSDNIFSLNNINPDLFQPLPTGGELLINLGGEYPDMDFSALIDMGMLDPTMNSNPSLLLNPEPNRADDNLYSSNNDLDQSGLYELLSTSLEEYSSSPSTSSQHSMPPTPAPLQPALSVDLSNTESQKSTSAYVPPSGAAQASSRRVGGSWKPPPFIHNEGSLDNMSVMLSAS
ncbi:hypothetical protein FA15DRAFT_755736 [Coprinopsis marcescibilis]|uniref:HMG box domain-containing protein n=1 Tax=Coprinopsis marcescibilis TaxID=230819 RepID=A0A5C3KYI1_COPMA|nr:hypothetical protein FA15DRAFT_755736 [Coprinopsis marcescibilis]